MSADHTYGDGNRSELQNFLHFPIFSCIYFSANYNTSAAPQISEDVDGYQRLGKLFFNLAKK